MEKEIIIGGETYYYKASLYQINKFLRKQGHTFGTIGEYLMDDLVEHLFALLIFGVNATGKKLTAEKLDELIGADMTEFVRLQEWIMDYYNLNQVSDGDGADEDSESPN